jgi:hypothetical protein
VDTSRDWDARGPSLDPCMGHIFVSLILISLFRYPFDVHFRTSNGVPVWTFMGLDILTSKTIKKTFSPNSADDFETSYGRTFASREST